MVHHPYYIQRCEIKRPLTEGRFSEVVQTDYMGSAEFEFGALPKSLRALQASVDLIQLTTEPRITEGERCLRVLHTFSSPDYEEYLGYLLELRADKRRTKEVTRFAAGRQMDRYSKTDLWWDIDNHVMFSFDKIFMNRLGDALVASWKYMDEQRAK